MAQDILTLFVYLFGAVLLVTLIEVAVAVFQIIEDVPFIRKQLWKIRSHGFRNIKNAHS